MTHLSSAQLIQLIWTHTTRVIWTLVLTILARPSGFRDEFRHSLLDDNRLACLKDPSSLTEIQLHTFPHVQRFQLSSNDHTSFVLLCLAMRGQSELKNIFAASRSSCSLSFAFPS